MTPEFERRLDEVGEEWNRAERAIKLAEQVNREVIGPAVSELRYGGRRLIEAFAKSKAGQDQKAMSLLDDAHFDCCRARHDAIDAATSKVAADLEIAIRRLGGDHVYKQFPKYGELFAELKKTRDKIATSRENRENRELVYDSIENDNLTKIIDLYFEFQVSEPLIVSAVKAERRALLIERAMWLTALVVGVSVALWIG